MRTSLYVNKATTDARMNRCKAKIDIMNRKISALESKRDLSSKEKKQLMTLKRRRKDAEEELISWRQTNEKPFVDSNSADTRSMRA